MLNSNKTYRLITRSDLDGLMCAILLNEKNLIDEVEFISPTEFQNSENFNISDRDIIANLPYHKNAKIVFDHHSSETIRHNFKNNLIIDTDAKSVSRVIFNYFGGSDNFKRLDWKLIKQVDDVKGNNLSLNDILYPEKWGLLSIILDERTNLEKFVGSELYYDKEDLCFDFINNILNIGIEEFLEYSSVQERIDILKKYQEDFEQQIKKCSVVQDNIVFLDRRKEEFIYPGNRYYIFVALSGEVEYLIHIIEAGNGYIKVAVRANPLNHKYHVDIGTIVSKFDISGGNKISGTILVPEEELNDTLKFLRNSLT